MTDIPKAAGRQSSWIFAGLYALAIILGILNGCCPTGAGSPPWPNSFPRCLSDFSAL